MTVLNRLMASCFVLLLVAGAAFAGHEDPKLGLSPEQCLKMLTVGNERFVSGEAIHPNANMSRRLMTTTNGQVPFATVLACSDSRVPVEILFDQGIGDLFVIKVAGNVADTDEIGSAEYGVDHLGTPILLVLGHSKCGAVTAVTKGAEVHGSIPKLVDNIIPAVEKAKKAHPEAAGEDLINAAIEQNVWQAIDDLLKNSPVIAERAAKGKVQVVGGIYDILTGKVTILPMPKAAAAKTEAAAAPEKNAHAKEAAGHEAAPAKASGGGFGFGSFLLFVLALIGVVIGLDKTILNPDKQ